MHGRMRGARRLMSVPGIGPISAKAIQAFEPPMEIFRRGRDFSAWLGLVLRQHTTGGKPKLGKISKMGQRDLRRLLITGAMTVVRWAIRRGVTTDPWLAGTPARKPRMLVAVALANRMARIVWALMMKKEVYRAPATAREDGEVQEAVGGAAHDGAQFERADIIEGCRHREQRRFGVRPEDIGFCWPCCNLGGGRVIRPSLCMASMVTLAIMSLRTPSGLTQPMRRQNSFDRAWRVIRAGPAIRTRSSAISSAVNSRP